MPKMFQDWNGDKTSPKMYFSNVKRQLRAPFAIYCDLESFLVPNEENDEIVHQLASASYFVVSDHPMYEQQREPTIIRGGDVLTKFLSRLWELQEEIEELFEDQYLKADPSEMIIVMRMRIIAIMFAIYVRNAYLIPLRKLETIAI